MKLIWKIQYKYFSILLEGTPKKHFEGEEEGGRTTLSNDPATLNIFSPYFHATFPYLNA